MTKSKIMIMILACVLAFSVIGGCFALYVKAADKITITIGKGESVTLVLGDAAQSNEGKLNPDNDLTYTVELSTNSSTTVTEAVQGRFYVTIPTTDADELADYVTVSASIDSTSVAHADLTDSTKGYICNLPDLPITVTLTFTLKETVDMAKFMELAGDKISVLLHWDIVTWEVNSDAYYLVGNFNGWTVANNNYLFKDNSNLYKTEYMLSEVKLTAGDQLKIVKGNKDTWIDSLRGSNIKYGEPDSSVADVSVAQKNSYDLNGNDNIVILRTGTYNIYYCSAHTTDESQIGIWIQCVDYSYTPAQ